MYIYTSPELEFTMSKVIIENVLIALRRVIRATDLHSRNLIKVSGLTAPQLLILQTINSRQGINVGDLAHEMSLSQATVSSILDRLEIKELIYREKSLQDKRKVHLHLTKNGKLAVKDAPLPLQTRFVREFAALEDWEQSQILSALQRIAHMMDAKDLDASPILDVGALDRHDIPAKEQHV